MIYLESAHGSLLLLTIGRHSCDPILSQNWHEEGGAAAPIKFLDVCTDLFYARK